MVVAMKGKGSLVHEWGNGMDVRGERRIFGCLAPDAHEDRKGV